MGDWTEAMEDGVICKGCMLPLGGHSVSGYCPDCAEKHRSPSRSDVPSSSARFQERMGVNNGLDEFGGDYRETSGGNFKKL